MLIIKESAYIKNNSCRENIKTEFSKFEKYKDAIPHGRCVL